MSIVIHAGFGKCGSTTIQAGLAANRETFEQQGFAQIGRDLSVGVGHPQKALLRAADERKNVVGKLARASASAPDQTIILSSEAMSLPEMATLFQGLDDYMPVHVVFYFRPQHSRIPSAWKQWGLKGGMSLMKCVKFCMVRNRPPYLEALLAWQRMLPGAKITVRAFVRELMEGGDPFIDFCEIAGLRGGEPPSQQFNTSFDYSLLDMMGRNAEELFIDAADNGFFDSLARVLPQKYLSTNAPMLSQESADMVTAHFQKENLTILRDFCGISDPEGFHERHFLPQVRELSYEEMDPTEVAVRAHQIVNEIADTEPGRKLLSLKGTSFRYV